MKQSLLLLFTFLFIGSIQSQTIIVNHEDPTTTTNFQYFGSTLDPMLNTVIANPDPSGINTSSMVGEYIKAAGAETWAGAFSSPNPMVPIDLIANSQICIKVWFPMSGSFLLKLEQSSTGGADWEKAQDVNDTNQWVELCYDANQPSDADPNQPAAGHSYDRVTIFFGFGQMGGADDITYYFDDIVLDSGSGATEGDITFSVDMNDYAGMFTTVYVSGTMNGWAGDANALEDMDGDGVWTGTIADIPVGIQEFKFTLDNWAAQEEFSPFTTCTIVDPSGQFVNRRLIVSGDATLPTYCFNSCYACGEGVNITFNVGQGNIALDPEGLHIAGGGNFGNPGDFPMDDSDGDGIWNITVEREKGFTSFYTFTNGACPDFGCKENIAGQDCANPDNFNDRLIDNVQSDTTINTCFGLCADNTDDCGSGASPGNITFQVDMNNFTDPFTTPYVAGNMNGWAGDANPMTDADGDGIWETTIMLNPGNYEYKFPLDNWAVDEVMTDGDPCTITDPSGQFVNRALTVDGDATICFVWGTCETCFVEPGLAEVSFNVDMSNYVDPFTTAYVSGGFNGWAGDANPLSDPDGDGIWSGTIELASGPQEFKFTLDNWAVQEEFMDGDPCTITDPSGMFVNRLLEVSGDTTICFEFNTCIECDPTSVNDITIDNSFFKIQPNPVSEFTKITFSNPSVNNRLIRVYSATGTLVLQKEIDGAASEYMLDVVPFAKGIYLISVLNNNVLGTQKMLKP